MPNSALRIIYCITLVDWKRLFIVIVIQLIIFFSVRRRKNFTYWKPDIYRKTDWQSYFLHLRSSHCMFPTKLQSFILIDLNIEHTNNVPLDVAPKINLPQAIFRFAHVSSFIFFVCSSSWNARYHISLKSI